MTRNSEKITNGEAGTVSGDITTIPAGSGETISLPDVDFVKTAEILREGQDLLLESPDGSVVVIEGYFNASPAPLLQSPDGQTLTPELVDAFVQQAGPLQYADAGTMTDESPVGSVSEVTGKATVTRTDGATETVTIGTPVFQGDIIETEDTGAVNLVFIDETSLAISQNAKLAIDEYVFDPASESGSTDFSILRGLFVFTSGLIGRDDPDDVNIDTPMGSIGIRGTVIAGNVDTGEITVMEGAIVLRAFNGQEMTLAQQFETAKFDPGGDVILMGQTTPENFADNFNAVKAVAPALFTSVESTNSAKDTETDTLQEGALRESPSGEQSETENTQQPAMEGAEPQAPQNDTFFDHSPDAGFDQSAGTGQTESVQTTQNNTITTTGTVTETYEAQILTSSETSGETTNSTSTMSPPPTTDRTDSGTSESKTLDLRSVSGADGYRIFGSVGENLGYSITAISDLNLNGSGNFVVTNNVTAGGVAYHFDGLNTAPTTNQILGSNNTGIPDISAAGDFDGDGMQDCIFGAPLSDATSTGNILLAGPNIGFTAGLSTSDRAGQDVSGIGDVNGDGYSDVLIGLPGADYSIGDDDGSAIVLLGNPAPSFEDASALTSGVRIDNVTDGQMFGVNVSGAGDYNNDGFSDFMVAHFNGASTGEVKLFTGNPNSTLFDTMADALHNITGIGTNGDVPIMHMGDMNGDGISDIGIADTLNEQYHILFGGGGTDTDLSDGVNSNGYTIFNSGSGFLDGGGYAGDFNGDGYDDGVVVIRDGTMADIFVIYGMPGTPAGNVLDIQSLYNNDDAAFHMTYNVGHNGGFDFVISTGGDLNGDGFDELLVGTPDAGLGDGGISVVYGRNSDAVGRDGDMMHIAGQTTAMDDVIANAANQHLVGNANGNRLDDNGMTGISFRAGAGDDAIRINNDNFVKIDGGTGIDTLEIFSANNLDFSGFGSEAVSGIEKIAMTEDSQTVTLGIDDIFRLMQESQDVMAFAGPENRKVLKIVDVYEFVNGTDGGNTTLNIENNIGGGDTFTGLGFTADTAVTDAGVTYDVYDFGGVDGYALLIDQNIENVAIV